MLLLTDTQFGELEAIYNTSSPTRYADIYDKIYAWVQLPSTWVPLPEDVETGPAGNIIAWFGAAAQTNRGVGGASDLIRSYTAAQLEIRQGAPIANINELMQLASNSIADSVYNDIKDVTRVVNGNIYHEIPSAFQIGTTDALETIETLAARIPNYSGGTATWSGNPLYIGLGIADFWEGNILNTPGDTYNIFVAIRAMWIGGINVIIGGWSGLADLVFTT